MTRQPLPLAVPVLLLILGIALAACGVLTGIVPTSSGGVDCGTGFLPAELWELPSHPDEAVVYRPCVALSTTVRAGAWTLIGMGATCFVAAVLLLIRRGVRMRREGDEASATVTA